MKGFKEYRTNYDNCRLHLFRDLAEENNLFTIIVGTEVNEAGKAEIVVEGNIAEVDVIVKLAKEAEKPERKAKKGKRITAVKRESEIFYTGGGIWCGVIPLDDGTWGGGEINDYLCIYKTRKSAFDSYGENDDNFIRWTTCEEYPQVLELWKKAIDYERTNVHGQRGYCDEWEDQYKRSVEASAPCW